MKSAVALARMSNTLDPKSRLIRTLASRLFSSLSAALVIFAVGCGGGSSTNTTTTTQTSTPVIDKALWVANGTNVVEFLPSQLSATSTNMAPHLSNNSGSFGAPQGVVFDAAGDLWVIDGGTVATGGTVKPALYEFTPAQLAALATTNNPTPNITIQSASFTFPQQAVFDPNGNLWVSDNGSNAVFVFTPAQLATANSAAAPYITITSNPAFTGPLGIVFDAQGDLFVANNGSTTIFEFKAANLPTTSTTVSLAPDATLSDDGKGSVQAPWALIFDTKGDLWSSNANAPNTIVEFAPTSLGATGSPVPAVTLSPTMVNNNSTLASPNGIAFDNLGDLATISSATPFGVALFGQAQLTAGGGIAPTAFLVGQTTTLNAPAGCNFGPVVN
jgi:hypothetical protein